MAIKLGKRNIYSLKMHYLAQIPITKCASGNSTTDYSRQSYELGFAWRT